jgi:CrcB protein
MKDFAGIGAAFLRPCPRNLRGKRMRLLWLMIAGALGAASRYGLTLAIQTWLGGRGARFFLATALGATFPLGTLVINVAGALLLSLLTTLTLHEAVNPDLRVILGTGFLGAFTTFSTFELESEGLLSRGEWFPASTYILGNLLLGFLAILIGRAIALRLMG